MPAAGAAARENGAAVLGFHARAKSVRLGAMAIIRLKGTFRHSDSRIKYSKKMLKVPRMNANAREYTLSFIRVYSRAFAA
jgi:hypothetical protein